MLFRVALIAAAAVWPGCDSGTPEAPPPSRPTTPAAAVAYYQCARCHEAETAVLPRVHRDRSCVGCHQDIFDRAASLAKDYEVDEAQMALWDERITSIREVPSLRALKARYTRDWFVRYLANPHDLRPAMRGTMPRLEIPAAEIELIADHFFGKGGGSAGGIGSATAAEVEAGRKAFVAEGCDRCHLFGGSGLPDRRTTPVNRAIRLAPDLRVTRDRMTAAALDRWLANPSKVLPGTHMPTPVVDATVRKHLVAFVLHATLAPPEPIPIPERLPVLTRKVGHAEVEKKVFKKICWHCHSDPEPVGGDGGPGNTGGFGYRGIGLDLGSREAILKGGVDPETGERVSYVEADASGIPRMVRVMLARHSEIAGKRVDGVLGMPLGLPPMPMTAIQLVESWIAQGCPE